LLDRSAVRGYRPNRRLSASRQPHPTEGSLGSAPDRSLPLGRREQQIRSGTARARRRSRWYRRPEV